MKTNKFEFLNKEITLSDIAEFLAIFKPAFKKSVLFIALFTTLFAVIGYFAKITSPKEFESTCVLYNELGGASPNSSSQALALLTGANSGNGMGESSGGDLYQLILTNKPFLLELAKTPIYVNKQKKSITLEQYFDKELELDVVERSIKAITNIPSTVKGWMSNTPKAAFPKKSLISDTAISNQLKGSFANNVYIADLTSEDRKIIGILAPRIKLTQSGKLSTLNIKMPEAILSAAVNKVVLELLIKYAIRFKASKQLENVEF